LTACLSFAGHLKEIDVQGWRNGTECIHPLIRKAWYRMNHNDTLRALDKLILSRTILNHPFYQAWQRGELDRGQLATYAKSYYPHVAAFPEYLHLAAAAAGDASARSEIESNLADELTNPAPHHELWLDFAAGVGLDRTAVSTSVPTAPALKTVQSFRHLAQGETAGALSAFYAYESQQPAVATTKMEGLRKFYGISDEATLAYFAVHAEKDIEHSAGERRAMLRCLEGGATAETVLSSANKALDAYWGLLDGICVEAGIACAP
jgi:pyrroloquinoline-quinone synthase